LYLTNPQYILIAGRRYLGHRGKTCDIIIWRGESRVEICHGKLIKARYLKI
jgi:hypothetical protein